MQPPVTSLLLCVMCSAVLVQGHAPYSHVDTAASLERQPPPLSNLQLLHPMLLDDGSLDQPFSNIPSEAFTLDTKTESKRTVKKNLGDEGSLPTSYLTVAPARPSISALVGSGLEDSPDTLEWVDINDFEDTKEYTPPYLEEIIDLVENGLDTVPKPRSKKQQQVTYPRTVENNQISEIIGFLLKKLTTLVNGKSNEESIAKPKDIPNRGSTLGSNSKPAHQHQDAVTKLLMSPVEKEISDLLENEFADDDDGPIFFTNTRPVNLKPQSNKDSKPTDGSNRGSNSVQKQIVYDLFGTGLKPEYEPMTLFVDRKPQSKKEEPMTPFVDRKPQSKKEREDPQGFYYVYKKRDSNDGNNDLSQVELDLSDGGLLSPSGGAGYKGHTGHAGARGAGHTGHTGHKGHAGSPCSHHSHGIGPVLQLARPHRRPSKNRRGNWSVLRNEKEKNGKPSVVV